MKDKSANKSCKPYKITLNILDIIFPRHIRLNQKDINKTDYTEKLIYLFSNTGKGNIPNEIRPHTIFERISFENSAKSLGP